MKKVIIALIVVSLIFLICIFEPKEKTGLIDDSDLSYKEKLELENEELKFENKNIIEEKSAVENRMEETEKELLDAKELIELLQNQLESYGIVPYEL